MTSAPTQLIVPLDMLISATTTTIIIAIIIIIILFFVVVTSNRMSISQLKSSVVDVRCSGREATVILAVCLISSSTRAAPSVEIHLGLLIWLYSSSQL